LSNEKTRRLALDRPFIRNFTRIDIDFECADTAANNYADADTKTNTDTSAYDDADAKRFADSDGDTGADIVGFAIEDSPAIVFVGSQTRSCRREDCFAQFGQSNF